VNALDAAVSEHLVDQVPDLAWLLFAIGVVVWLRHEIRDRASSLSGVNLPGGLALQFAEKVGQVAEERGKVLPGSAQTRLARRAERHAGAVNGMRLLWIDDDVDSTKPEREALTRIGVHITTATSSEEALDLLTTETYDLILSDIARGDDPQAGISFAAKLRESGNAVPVVFYIADLDATKGVPAPAVGITDRPSELVHLVFDQAERLRG
jgi:CheY-like chemotaxis protein